MITLESFSEVPARVRGAYLTVGNFDGVHLGHARLLARLSPRPMPPGARVAMTFDPHPVALLRPEKTPVPLVWPEREVALLRRSRGGPRSACSRPAPGCSGSPPGEFFERVDVGQFEARGMVEGPNFAFGRDRGGDDHASWPSGAARPGSTSRWSSRRCRWRSHLLLAHPPVPVGGRRRGGRAAARPPAPHPRDRDPRRGAGGRASGSRPPTSTPSTPSSRPTAFTPSRAFVDGQDPPWPAACNIGPNPTFGEHSRKVEAHLIGFTATFTAARSNSTSCAISARPASSRGSTTCSRRSAPTWTGCKRSARFRRRLPVIGIEAGTQGVFLPTGIPESPPRDKPSRAGNGTGEDRWQRTIHGRHR